MNKKVEIRNCISSDISYFHYFMKFRKLKVKESIVIANWNIEEVVFTLEYIAADQKCFTWHMYQGKDEKVSFSFDSLHGFISNLGEQHDKFFYWDFQQRIFCFGDDNFYLLFITSEEESPVYAKRIYILQDQKYYQIDFVDALSYVYIQTVDQDDMIVGPLETKKLQLHMLTPLNAFFGGIAWKNKEDNICIPLIGKLEKKWIHVGDAFLSPELWKDAIQVTFLNGNGNYISMPEE